jgi:hypothetical protein
VVIDRVQLPENRSLAGFGRNGDVYLSVRDAEGNARVERAKSGRAERQSRRAEARRGGGFLGPAAILSFLPSGALMAVSYWQRTILTAIGVGIVVGLVVGLLGALLGLSAGVRGGLTGAFIVVALHYLRKQMKRSQESEVRDPG